MKKYLRNPIVLIVAAFILLIIVAVLGNYVHNSELSNAGNRTAISTILNLVSVVLGLAAVISLVTGAILGVRWLLKRV
jgi:Na+-transporting methylmalonyl-CoA/oxaloacetate decarboxylase beta subunit